MRDGEAERGASVRWLSNAYDKPGTAWLSAKQYSHHRDDPAPALGLWSKKHGSVSALLPHSTSLSG
jgi:hypothetical protein